MGKWEEEDELPVIKDFEVSANQSIDSNLVTPKKSGMMRICLDPNDLNKAIL